MGAPGGARGGKPPNRLLILVCDPAKVCANSDCLCFQAGPWALLKRHYYGELDDSPSGGSPRMPRSSFLDASFASWAVEGGGAPGWRLFRVVQTAPNGLETEMQQLQAQTQRRRAAEVRAAAAAQQAAQLTAQQAAQQDVQDRATAAQQQQQPVPPPRGQEGPAGPPPQQQQPPAAVQPQPANQPPPNPQLPGGVQWLRPQLQGPAAAVVAAAAQPAVPPLAPPLTPPRHRGNGSNVLRCAGIEFWGVMTYDHAAAKPPLEEEAGVEDEGGEGEEEQGAELPGAGGGEQQLLGEAAPPAAAEAYDTCVLEYLLRPRIMARFFTLPLIVVLIPGQLLGQVLRNRSLEQNCALRTFRG